MTPEYASVMFTHTTGSHETCCVKGVKLTVALGTLEKVWNLDYEVSAMFRHNVLGASSDAAWLERMSDLSLDSR